MADEKASSASSRVTWTDPKIMLPILTQIISVGEVAFMTQEANVKANPTLGIEAQTYNQKDVWLNKTSGIITLLKHPEFGPLKHVPWPDNHAAVLQAVARYVNSHAHLHTPGQEQAEPAAAGTAGTKDEVYGELHEAIVAVAQLKELGSRVGAVLIITEHTLYPIHIHIMITHNTPCIHT